LLTWLGLAVPHGVRLILIFDRGYARVELIKDLNHGQQPFLIRGRRKVIVQTKVRLVPADCVLLVSPRSACLPLRS